MGSGVRAAALRLMGMGGRFVLLLLIGRTLTPEDLGAYGLFAATSLILVQAVGIELHQPAVRELLRRSGTDREAVVRAQLRTYAIAYLLLPPVVALACANGLVTLRHALLLVAVIVGSHLSLEAHRLLIAARRQEHAFLVLSVAQGLWVYPLAAVMAVVPELRSLTLVFATWAVASLVAAAAGFRGVCAAGLLRPGSGARHDAAFLRSAWPSAATFMASSTAFLVIESLDRFFLAHFHGQAEVGIYTLYSGVARVLREIGFAAIVSASLPILVAATQRRNRDAARDEQLRMTRRVSIYVLAAAPALGAGLLLVLPLLNDARYESALPAFFVLLASAIVGTYAMVPHYVLYAAGRERSILAIHLATLLATIAANWLLVPTYGITGAAIASGVSAVFMCGLKWALAKGSRPLGPQA